MMMPAPIPASESPDACEPERFLEIDNLSMMFSSGTQTVVALRDFSCSVREGQFVSIVGPSGCGKTTLLRVVAGLIAPSAGKVTKRCKELAGPDADRGMVFQSYTSFPWLTVRENVEFGLMLRDVPERARRETSDNLIRTMGLAEFADRYPHNLSGGMKQRVAIARTLANDPEILLMDEPFGALDTQTRWEMQELLMNSWEYGRKTVLFVTHDVEEALFLADRVIVLTARPGRLKRDISVPFPYPRSPDVKTERAFLDLKKEIIHLVRDERHTDRHAG